jgi:hypothetical protein
VITDEYATPVVATRGPGTWLWRLVIVIAALAVVWLYAFVAESRADGLTTTAQEVADVVDPDSSAVVESPTAAGETAASTDPSTADESTDPTAGETGTGGGTTPVDQPPTIPPVDQPPTIPPVDQPPTTPPVDPPPTTPPVDPPPTTPLGDQPVFAHSPHDGSASFTPAISGDAWISNSTPVDLLSRLGPAASPSGVGDSHGAGGAPNPSDSQKTSSPNPMPRAPWAPQQDRPFGGFGGGGVFGGSSGGGGGGGGAPVVLVALIGLFALAQLFGSRLSTATTPLRGAAPAFQLKRPG